MGRISIFLDIILTTQFITVSTKVNKCIYLIFILVFLSYDCSQMIRIEFKIIFFLKMIILMLGALTLIRPFS